MVLVAIFGSATFDVYHINPATIGLANASIKLKSNGQPMASYLDINNDGFIDIIAQVPTQALQLTQIDGPRIRIKNCIAYTVYGISYITKSPAFAGLFGRSACPVAKRSFALRGHTGGACHVESSNFLYVWPVSSALSPPAGGLNLFQDLSVKMRILKQVQDYISQGLDK